MSVHNKSVYILRIQEELNSIHVQNESYDGNQVFTDCFFAYKFMCDFLEEPRRKRKIAELYEDVPGTLGIAPNPDVVDMLNTLDCNMPYDITHGSTGSGADYYVSVKITKHILNPRYSPV